MITKGPLIAEGNTAEVFAWGNSHVLKLYRPSYPASEAEREANLVQTVIDAGIQTPSVVEIVTVEGRAGVVFERVDGPTMLDLMLGNSYDFVTYADLLAELHSGLHRLTSTALPNLHEQLRARLLRSRDNRLLSRLVANISGFRLDVEHTASIEERILESLTQLPVERVICHGDFHPLNIVMTDDGPVIIDWIDTASGHPAADVARTMILFKYSILPTQLGQEVIQQIEQFRHLFVEAYVQRYCELSAMTQDEITPWIVSIAAGRLINDQMPEEGKRRLVDVVMFGL